MSQKRPLELRTVEPQPTFNLRRFRAALDIQGGSIEGLARDARVSGRHIWYFLHGKRRASANLLGIIRAALGEAGWAFATGQTDTLRDEGGSDAKA